MTTIIAKNQKVIAYIKNAISILGYKEDRYGNYTKVEENELYRYRFNKTSYKHEVKVFDRWICLTDIHYKDVYKYIWG